LVLFFLLLVAPLAVIHDSANGGLGGGCDFDQVQPGFLGHFEGVGGRDDANLVFVMIDQSNRRDPDLMIVAEVCRNGSNLLKNSPASDGTTPPQTCVPFPDRP